MGLGIAQLICLTIGIYGLNHVGERVTKKLQQSFLAAIMRQNIAFFDGAGTGELTIRLSNDMSLIRDGISQKVGLISYGFAGFISAIIVSFIKDWRLALVLLCLPLVIILTMGGLGSAMKKFQEQAGEGYAESGNFAEEVIAAIRSVVAYGSQRRFLKKYELMLERPERADFRSKMLLGMLVAIMMMIINLGYGLAVSHRKHLRHHSLAQSQLVLARPSIPPTRPHFRQQPHHGPVYERHGWCASRSRRTLHFRGRSSCCRRAANLCHYRKAVCHRSYVRCGCKTLPGGWRNSFPRS